jgi:regulator of sirC expression with transglutaminase-like and TPR domain
MIARIEYPKLDIDVYLDRLDTLGRDVAPRMAVASVVAGVAPPRVDPSCYAQVMLLNDYLFNELRFVGNEVHYDDPRNSLLNEVLDRRTGIPITLALLYMEVARRAGLHVEGINFPGHFLLRCPPRRGQPYSEGLIIDAFHGGAILSEDACRELLRRHAGDEAVYDSGLQGRATKTQILVRMLLNLKRTYVQMYSFPQARDVIQLPLASPLHHQRDPRSWAAGLSPQDFPRRFAARSSSAARAQDPSGKTTAASTANLETSINRRRPRR